MTLIDDHRSAAADTYNSACEDPRSGPVCDREHYHRDRADRVADRRERMTITGGNNEALR